VDVNPLHGVVLGLKWVNRMSDKGNFVPFSYLFIPVKAVVMSLANNKVIHPVFVDVCDDDRHAGMLEVECRVEFPLAIFRIFWRLQPSSRHDEISVSIAINISKT